MPSGIYTRTKEMYLTRIGKPSWNKGLKCSQFLGKNNGFWKGEKVSYAGIHKWLERNFVKSGKCEGCLENKKTTWANKSGKYLREKFDWLELCYKCHSKYDKDNKNQNKYKEEVKLNHLKYRYGE